MAEQIHIAVRFNIAGRLPEDPRQAATVARRFRALMKRLGLEVEPEISDNWIGVGTDQVLTGQPQEITQKLRILEAGVRKLDLAVHRRPTGVARFTSAELQEAWITHEKLHWRPRRVLELRYALGTPRQLPLTLDTIGMRLELTRESIRKIEKDAIKKLLNREFTGQ